MMNIEDLAENSESSDEDYIPEVSNADLPSEEDSDGEEEDGLIQSEELNTARSTRSRKSVKSRKKQKIPPPATETTAEKLNTDDLWADFKKDTGFKTRAERQIVKGSNAANDEKATIIANEGNETLIQTKSVDLKKPLKVTEVYKFAGEEIKVEKDISSPSASRMPIKRGPKTGINSILGNIGKKTKINTLEKSKLDWDRFKKEENIEDELQAYSKSKDGYLEKQDFLQRADLRRFEIEKDIRSTLRTNRMNNV